MFSFFLKLFFEAVSCGLIVFSAWVALHEGDRPLGLYMAVFAIWLLLAVRSE